mgnify:CR=1 FL=1
MTRVIKPVPRPARVLLDFISIPESRGQYDVWSSFKQNNLPKPLTKSTIAEVLEYQLNYRTIGGISSAAGRYQIIRNTLLMLCKMLNLQGDELFDAGMQDRLGYQLMKIRGYDAWMAGALDDNAFANKLAREWASLPVVTAQKNYKGRWIKPGTSYYDGDGLNSHGVDVKSVLDTLKKAKATTGADDAFVPVPKSKPSKKVLTGAAAAGGAVVIAGEAAATVTPEQLMEYYNTLKPIMDLAISYGPWGVGALVIGIAAYVGYRRYA